jgi:hypothetical protein
VSAILGLDRIGGQQVRRKGASTTTAGGFESLCLHTFFECSLDLGASGQTVSHRALQVRGYRFESGLALIISLRRLRPPFLFRQPSLRRLLLASPSPTLLSLQ